MAAGLSIDEQALKEFQCALEDQVTQSINDSDLQAHLITDGDLTVDQITMSTAQLAKGCRPLGTTVPRTLFRGGVCC